MGLIDSIKDRLTSKGPVDSGDPSGRAQRSGKKVRNPPEQGGPQQGPQSGRDGRRGSPQNQSQSWRQNPSGPQDKPQPDRGPGPQGPQNADGPGPGLDQEPPSPDTGPGQAPSQGPSQGPAQGPGGPGQQDSGVNPPNQFDEPMDNTGKFGQDELGQDGPGPGGPQGGGPQSGPQGGPQGRDMQGQGSEPNFERGQKATPSRGPGMQSSNRSQQQNPPEPPRGGNEEPPSPDHYNMDLPDAEETPEELHSELRQIMRQNERIIDLLEQITRKR